ncbi:MAG: ferredoxin--NADP reductase [Flavisolibacter sp.]|nr:ferredoxin--NADP reductase [Flavisolibacter sp.]
MLYKPVIIEQIQEQVEGFKTFTFKQGHGIEYKAGQYITFVQQTLHESIRRSYSIASAPLLNEPLTIGVKRIENGAFSRQLIDHAKPGDELLTIGAGGFFTLPDEAYNIRQIFFLAAGSGITPIYSLLKTVLHFHPHIHVVLIYSNPTPQKTIFFSQLNELKEKFSDRFELRFLFSNSANLLTARLNRELLVQLTKAHCRFRHDETLFYLCGPEAYMRMCTYTLQEEQVPKENIRKETFIIQGKQPPKKEPPDKNDHTVLIQYGNENYQLRVQYPDSILQAAKKENISLPYSCEVGRCGNCAAKCVDGKVWLSYNEVLTEKDIQKGLTLTCVGHPVGGDVTLKI